MEKVVQVRDEYFVYINSTGKVTIPDWKEDRWVYYFEIAKETVKDWPSYLRGMTVSHKEIIWL
jgi:hypothetical protein